MHTPRSSVLVAASLFPILWLVQAAGAADRVIVFGDSWSDLGFNSLRDTFVAHAPGNDAVDAAISGLEADEMNSSNPSWGLPFITSTIAAHPTADLVHLSLGGNDLRTEFHASLTPAEQDALLTGIADNIEAVVTHIVSQRPDIEVFYSSYDYLRPLPNMGTPFEVNTVLEQLQSRMESRLAGIPRATTHSFYGLMQTLFGQSEFGLAPGDSSLPDIHLPGPPEAFWDEIHLSFDMGFGGGPFGYDLLAEEQYDAFYKWRMEPVTGDFDSDGDGDGADFLFWQRGDYPDPLSPSYLAAWEDRFGSSGMIVAGASEATAIPEPSAFVSMVLGLTFFLTPSAKESHGSHG